MKVGKVNSHAYEFRSWINVVYLGFALFWGGHLPNMQSKASTIKNMWDLITYILRFRFNLSKTSGAIPYVLTERCASTLHSLLLHDAIFYLLV